MARGGFIALAIALDRVYPFTSSRREAAQVISDALISGTITARGCPVKLVEPEKEESRDKRGLIDLTSLSFERVFGDMVEIPKSFWLAAEDISVWDGTRNHFTDLSPEIPVQFAEVSVNEKDVNNLIKRRQTQPQAEKPHPQERRRQPSWDQWVAAVACLAHEHQIEPNMTQASFLDRVSARLQSWNLDEMPASTVAPAARAILDRYRSDPPTDPLVQDGYTERKP